VLIGGVATPDRQHPPFEGYIHPIGANTGHFGEDDDIVSRFVNVGWRNEYRTIGCVFATARRSECPLIGISDFLGHDCFSPLGSSGTDLDFFRPVSFQPL
jgi:hypothetical protein